MALIVAFHLKSLPTISADPAPGGGLRTLIEQGAQGAADPLASDNSWFTCQEIRDPGEPPVIDVSSHLSNCTVDVSASPGARPEPE